MLTDQDPARFHPICLVHGKARPKNPGSAQRLFGNPIAESDREDPCMEFIRRSVSGGWRAWSCDRQNRLKKGAGRPVLWPRGFGQLRDGGQGGRVRKQGAREEKKLEVAVDSLMWRPQFFPRGTPLTSHYEHSSKTPSAVSSDKIS